MTDGSADKYRDLYIEEKFLNVHKSINKLDDDMNEIKGGVKEIIAHVKKTNGRVTTLEINHEKCPVLEIKDNVGKLKKETEVVRFFCKHPQIAKLSIIGLFVLLAANIVLKFV